jgi:hypothetical protein
MGGVHEFPEVHFAFVVVRSQAQKLPIQPATTLVPATIKRFSDVSTTCPRNVIDELAANLLLQLNDAAFLKLLGRLRLHNVDDTTLVHAQLVTGTGCSSCCFLDIILIATFKFDCGIIIGTTGIARCAP